MKNNICRDFCLVALYGNSVILLWKWYALLERRKLDCEQRTIFATSASKRMNYECLSAFTARRAMLFPRFYTW